MSRNLSRIRHIRAGIIKLLIKEIQVFLDIETNNYYVKDLAVSIRTEEDRSFNQETTNLENFEDFLFLA